MLLMLKLHKRALKRPQPTHTHFLSL